MTDKLGREFDDATREKLEDECEGFLYALYDEVSPQLAAHFNADPVFIGKVNKEVRRIFDKFVSEGKISPLEKPPLYDGNLSPEENLKIWRQPARSSVLALLDQLVGDGRSKAVSPANWAARCGETLDFAAFKQETALDFDDALTALDITAKAIVSSSRLQNPVTLLIRGNFVTLAASGGNIKASAASLPAAKPQP